jgi:60 kDa SS-A/Ro ribonucleoprotein
VGNAPSLADIIKMVHPKPESREQAALFAWVMGKDTAVDKVVLPDFVKQLAAFRADPTAPQPNVPFELLTSTPLTTEHWKQIAKTAGWHMLRMNLNTFGRNGVFADPKMITLIADRLQDEQEIKKAKVFPYQCLTAFMYVDDGVPMPIKLALQKILDESLENIPKIEGQLAVFLDVSGSMRSPITGSRPGATSKMSCVSVASMIAAALLKKNPDALILPFDTRVHTSTQLNPMDSIATITKTLASFGGGGTNCSLPMEWLHSTGRKVDLIVYVSDNESWVDALSQSGRGWASNKSAATRTMEQWTAIKRRYKSAKMVCIDLTPNASVQAPSTSKDIMNVGGFSDNVFTVLSEFVKGNWSPDFWVCDVEAIEL